MSSPVAGTLSPAVPAPGDLQLEQLHRHQGPNSTAMCRGPVPTPGGPGTDGTPTGSYVAEQCSGPTLSSYKQVSEAGMLKGSFPGTDDAFDSKTGADTGGGAMEQCMHDEHAPQTSVPHSMSLRSMATLSSSGSAACMTSMHAPDGESRYTDAMHGLAEGPSRTLQASLLRCSTAASFVKDDISTISDSSDTSDIESPVHMHEQPEVVMNAVHVHSCKSPTKSDVLEPLLPTSMPTGPTVFLGAPGRLAVPFPRDEVRAGMLYYAVGSMFYAGMAVCSKILQNDGYPVWELTFFRSLIVLAVSLSAILSAGSSPWGVRKGLLFLRGTLGFANAALFFMACYFLPIATATTFTFLSPLIVALLSPWFLREAVSRAAAVVIPLCIAGLVLITQPAAVFGSAAIALSATGLVMGLSQPFFDAAVKMVVRELRKTEGPQIIIFYLVSCTLFYSCLGCALTWRHLVTPATWRDCLLLLSLGVCNYGNQLCTTKGLAKGKAASVMGMQYCCIVFTQLAGVALFAEYPTVPQGLGMGLIIVSMVGYLSYESRTDKC